MIITETFEVMTKKLCKDLHVFVIIYILNEYSERDCNVHLIKLNFKVKTVVSIEPHCYININKIHRIMWTDPSSVNIVNLVIISVTIPEI